MNGYSKSDIEMYPKKALELLKTGPRVSRGFLYVSYPPRIELWTLDENSKKENEKECVKAVLYIVILEYSLYSKLSCCIRFIQEWRNKETRIKM